MAFVRAVDLREQPWTARVGRAVPQRWAVALWMVLLCGGMVLLWDYGARPGIAGAAPESWPSGVDELALASGQPTLLFFAHPQCPCTRASLAELRGVLQRHKGKVSATALFVTAEGMGEDWTQSTLWNAALEIPGLRVVSDLEGRMARRFDAQTSGMALVFGVDGALRYRGGVTGARGHAGPNAGVDGLEAALKPGNTLVSSHLVFGCPLFAEATDRGQTP